MPKELKITSAIQEIVIASHIAKNGARFEVPAGRRFLTAASKLDRVLDFFQGKPNTELVRARAHEIYGDIALDADQAVESLSERPEVIALRHYDQAIALLGLLNPNRSVDDIMRITEKKIKNGLPQTSQVHPNGQET